MPDPKPNPPQPDAKAKGGKSSKGDSGRVVQLTRNFKGRQAGETFKHADAEKLGLLEHCKPFEPAPGE